MRRPPFNEPKIKYDHFKTDLAPETVVHIWKAVTNVTEVVANGYDVLVNVGYVPRSWYLDNTKVGWRQCYAKNPCGEVLRSTDPGLWQLTDCDWYKEVEGCDWTADWSCPGDPEHSG